MLHGDDDFGGVVTSHQVHGSSHPLHLLALEREGERERERERRGREVEKIERETVETHRPSMMIPEHDHVSVRE